MVKHLRERDEEGEESLQEFHRYAETIDRRDRVLLKSAEERSVFEEVFDRQTLMILYDLSNDQVFSYLNGVISSGKESRVYWGVKQDGTDVAVKIYLVASSDYKKRMHYIVGDPRFRKIRRDSRGVAELWARKEFTNLEQAYSAGVSVPKPHAFLGNVLVMEFVGKGGVKAPRLIETDVIKKDYSEIIKAVRLLYTGANLVHCDLSEYNVFKLEGKIILFDFGSAVSVQHPSALQYLRRDVENLNRFFDKRGIKIQPAEKVFSKVTAGQAKEA